MCSIMNLFTQYQISTYNNSSNGPQKSKDFHPIQGENDGSTKVELGRKRNAYMSDIYRYRSAAKSRITSSQTTRASADAEAQNVIRENSQAKKPLEVGVPLIFQEAQQTTLKGFKSALGTKEGEANYSSLYDADNNGVINILDWPAFAKDLQNSFQEMKQAWGSTAEEDNYDSRYDFDKNGAINILDWAGFTKKWGG